MEWEWWACGDIWRSERTALDGAEASSGGPPALRPAPRYISPNGKRTEERGPSETEEAEEGKSWSIYFGDAADL